MSVVNKVLRDLDARHAGANERSGVPSAVTPLSVHLAKRRPWSLLVMGLASLCVAAVATLWIVRPAIFFKGGTSGSAPVVAAAPPKPIVAAAPTPAPPAVPPVPVTAPALPPLPTLADAKPLAAEPLPRARSEAAAKSGTSEPKPGRAPAVMLRAGGYYLQIGAFSQRDNALALGEQLRRDVTSLADRVVVTSAGRMTLVQMGPWVDAGEARQVADLLRSKHGIDSAPIMKATAGARESLSADSALAAAPALSSLPADTTPGPKVTPVSIPPTPVPTVESMTPASALTAPPPATSTASRSKGAGSKEAKATQGPADGHIDKQARLPTAVERADATYRRGIMLHRQGQLDDAAALFRAALEDYSEHPAARQALAGLLIDTRRYDEAEAVLRKGVDINAVRLPSVIALARLKVERNQVSTALELLQQNADSGERSADYQGFMGALLNRLGRFREASDRYQAAAQLAPTEGRWLAALGIALEAQGRNAEARDAYIRAKNLAGLPSELEQHIDQRLR